MKRTLLFLKNHDFSLLIGVVFSKSSNCSLEITGLLFRNDGNKRAFTIPETAYRPAKKRKEGKYPPNLMFMNSPMIGPIRSPTPAAVSA